MAALLISVDQSTLTYLKDLLSRYPDWESVPDADKNQFQAIFVLNAGYFGSHYYYKPDTAFNDLSANQSNLEDYLALKEAPLTDQAQVDGALLSGLVNDMHLQQAQVDAIVDKFHSRSSRADRDRLRKLLILQSARQIAIKNNLNHETSTQFNYAVNSINPKPTAETPTAQAPSILEAAAIVETLIASVPEVFTATNPVTPADQDRAVAVVVAAASVLNLGNAEDRELVTAVALHEAVPAYTSDVTKIVDQIDQVTVTANAKDYVDQTLYPDRINYVLNPATNTKVPIELLSLPTTINTLPEQELLKQAGQKDHRFDEHIKTLDQRTEYLTERIAEIAIATQIAAAIVPQLPDSVINTILHEAEKIVPDNIHVPNSQGGIFIGFTKAAPQNPEIIPAAAKLASYGVTSQVFLQLKNYAALNPQSAIAYALNNPLLTKQFAQVELSLQNIAKSPILNSELNPAKSAFFQRFDSFTNKISGFMPRGVSTPLNFVFHPVDSIRNYFGQKVGQYIANKFVGQIGNAALRQAGKLVLEKGLSGALKQFATQAALKIAAKVGINVAGKLAVGLALGSAGGPIGWAVAIAGVALDWLAEKVIKHPDKLVMAPIAALAAMSGLVTAPASAASSAAQGLGAALGAAAAAATAVAASTFITAGAAIAVALFLYFTAFTAAPLISTLVQLQSGFDITRPGFYPENGNPALPPGPLPNSCPQGLPLQKSFPVTEGPRIGSHTAGWRINIGGEIFTSEGEAIDYGVPTGNAAIATHDGQAYYFPFGSNPPSGYGNYVAIISTCEGRKFVSIYAHLIAGNIPSGGPTAVTKGQLIGYTDNTGTNTTGAHLHYELMGLGNIYRYLETP